MERKQITVWRREILEKQGGKNQNKESPLEIKPLLLISAKYFNYVFINTGKYF